MMLYMANGSNIVDYATAVCGGYVAALPYLRANGTVARMSRDDAPMRALNLPDSATHS